jgi:hypothetical protein
MSTKNNPGAFRCYDAALPDEPIFTILARDPAAPATLAFWANERARQGKIANPDDKDRIHDAMRDASLMADWRAANLDPLGDGGPPAWKAVIMDDNELGPVRVQPDPVVYVHADRDGDEAVRLSIEWLQRQTAALTSGEITREFFAELMEHACQSPDRRRERVVPVEEAAFDAAKRDERTIAMMSVIQSAIGKLDDLGAIPGYALTINDIRETLFKGLEAAPMAAMPREQVVVDSQPHDLAHNPEVPPHRFSTFHKGENYAYARGLEINPIHLPTALDAMQRDGWHLLAIFGQTDSQHVGFIFKRQPGTVFFPSGMSVETVQDIQRTGGVVTSINGKPCGPDGMGRGLEP